MSRRAVALLCTALAAMAACGSDGTPGVASPPTTPAASGPAPAEDPDVGSTTGLQDQFGQRYCEVLTIRLVDGATEAEVWGTQGLNDCPQAAFEQIDPAAIAGELDVAAVLPNGPRHWVLDEIVGNRLAGSGEIRSFAGIDMRSIAKVDLGAGVPSPQPYAERSVVRDTVFTFADGREVYELSAPDGSVYVMQSFSEEIDPTLRIGDLADLGDRLRLPDGWAFTSRVLDAPLEVEDIDGIATVIQDDFNNTYQLLTRN